MQTTPEQLSRLDACLERAILKPARLALSIFPSVLAYNRPSPDLLPLLRARLRLALVLTGRSRHVRRRRIHRT